jgi:hypothetical protein
MRDIEYTNEPDDAIALFCLANIDRCYPSDCAVHISLQLLILTRHFSYRPLFCRWLGGPRASPRIIVPKPLPWVLQAQISIGHANRPRQMIFNNHNLYFCHMWYIQELNTCQCKVTASRKERKLASCAYIGLHAAFLSFNTVSSCS